MRCDMFDVSFYVNESSDFLIYLSVSDTVKNEHEKEEATRHNKAIHQLKEILQNHFPF